MKMNKKIIISIIGLIFAFVIFFVISKLISNSEENRKFDKREDLENSINISENGINDECTEEWIKYNEELQTAFIEANSSAFYDSTHYVIKNQGGYIYIFYLNDEKEEIPYKKTNISTEYLSKDDLEKLEDGIEVIGIEELNKKLEDYE